MGVIFLVLGGLGLLFRGSVILRFTAIFRPDEVTRRVTEQQISIGRKLFILAGFGGLRRDFRRYRGALPPVFMVVSNHQSLADIAVLPQIFPGHHLRFVAKKELARGVPYVSLSLRLGRHAVISRTSDYRAGRRILTRLADLTAEGVCPMVFPEGRRSGTGEVQQFQSGAFRIILERAPLPVLSVALDGGYRISTLTKLLTGLPGTCYRAQPLTLYPPPRGKREILDLLTRIEREIRGQVHRWREAPAAGSGRGRSELGQRAKKTHSPNCPGMRSSAGNGSSRSC
ncbi:MAG TPA: lysophospholipid acyltransferase family protein [Spirochaetia bacterium]|nr:lysophospholipid acyltransferase family protein [Spirochaetia bacterium]